MTEDTRPHLLAHLETLITLQERTLETLIALRYMVELENSKDV